MYSLTFMSKLRDTLEYIEGGRKFSTKALREEPSMLNGEFLVPYIYSKPKPERSFTKKQAAQDILGASISYGAANIVATGIKYIMEQRAWNACCDLDCSQK